MGLLHDRGLPLCRPVVGVMRKLLLLLPLIALLTACQSKRDICARALVGDEGENGFAVARKLGISPVRISDMKPRNNNATWGKIREFCRFYEN